MGVDYEGVGGIGIKVTEEMVETMIAKGIFSREDHETDSWCVIDGICKKYNMLYCEAGCCYSGDTYKYLFVKGDNLKEINKNKDEFKKSLKTLFGKKFKDSDLKVIEDIYVS